MHDEAEIPRTRRVHDGNQKVEHDKHNENHQAFKQQYAAAVPGFELIDRNKISRNDVGKPVKSRVDQPEQPTDRIKARQRHAECRGKTKGSG